MTTYTMLHDVPAVMAAIGRGEPIHICAGTVSPDDAPVESGAGWVVWSSVGKWGDADIASWLSDGHRMRSARIASPSRQAMGSQVVSDGDVLVMVREFFSPRHNGTEARMRAAASALLARSPCAQGHGDEAMLSWSGFNVHGDAASIAEVKRTVHNCGQFDAGFRHPAPPSAPASTHAAQAPVIELPAWPTREELREVGYTAYHNDWSGSRVTDLIDAIADAIHTKYFTAGGRDGEGS